MKYLVPILTALSFLFPLRIYAQEQSARSSKHFITEVTVGAMAPGLVTIDLQTKELSLEDHLWLTASAATKKTYHIFMYEIAEHAFKTQQGYMFTQHWDAYLFGSYATNSSKHASYGTIGVEYTYDTYLKKHVINFFAFAEIGSDLKESNWFSVGIGIYPQRYLLKRE